MFREVLASPASHGIPHERQNKKAPPLLTEKWSLMNQPDVLVPSMNYPARKGLRNASQISGSHTATGLKCQGMRKIPDPPATEFAGGSRRWVRRRTRVRQAPTNKEDPVKSAALKGQKNEKKKSRGIRTAQVTHFLRPFSGNSL